MAKALINVTQSWQIAANGAAVFTIQKRGTGAIYFNETEDDTTAHKSTPDPEDQFQQTEALITRVRSTGDGWQIIADGVL